MLNWLCDQGLQLLSCIVNHPADSVIGVLHQQRDSFPVMVGIHGLLAAELDLLGIDGGIGNVIYGISRCQE